MTFEIVDPRSASQASKRAVISDQTLGEVKDSQNKGKALDLGQLGLDYHLSGKAGTAGVPKVGSEAIGPQSKDKQAGIDIVAEGKLSPLFRGIYEQIDAQLVYPAELRQEKIVGMVTATFVLSKRGQIVAESTEIRSSSKYLAVVVARTLRKAFTQPIPSFSRYSDQDLLVKCSFDFQITEHNDAQLARSRRWFAGNQLAFYRHFQHSALEWQIGPLAGLGPFTGLNLLWFPQAIGDALSKKAKIDPLESYRDDPAW